MKIKSTIALFLITLEIATAGSALETLKQLYPYQSEDLLRQRLMLATGPHDKWRSFPPYYFYLLEKLKLSQDPLFGARLGFCTGDAHFENFGFIVGDRTTFSINDFDDSSPCSLNADLMRLFISHRLLSPAVDPQRWLESYSQGFSGATQAMPTYLQNLAIESATKGTGIPKKMLKLLSSKTCSGDYDEVMPEERKRFAQQASAQKKELIHLCTRTKDTGGSAGLRRFVVFTRSDSLIEALEYKPLVTPAPMFNQVLSAESRKGYLTEAVRKFLAEDFLSKIGPADVDEVPYLRRSLRSGNVGVKYEDIPEDEILEVAYFEAYTLGRLHTKSNTLPLNLNDAKWSEIAERILNKWDEEFIN